jgi:hypothetical protein
MIKEKRMKVTIEYEKTTDTRYPCGAFVWINKKCIYSNGVTWVEAREGLIKKLNDLLLVNDVPPMEEIDVPEEVVHVS